MKDIRILTVDDVEIKKFRWWSSWIDVTVCNNGAYAYLLQMKINRLNSKKFKSINIGSSGINVALSQVDNLVQANRFCEKSANIQGPKL